MQLLTGDVDRDGLATTRSRRTTTISGYGDGHKVVGGWEGNRRGPPLSFKVPARSVVLLPMSARRLLRSMWGKGKLQPSGDQGLRASEPRENVVRVWRCWLTGEARLSAHHFHPGLIAWRKKGNWPGRVSAQPVFRVLLFFSFSFLFFS